MADMMVAQTILNQLGHRRFVAMTGAKNLVGTDNSLSFRIGRNCKNVNWVKIIHNAADLYDLYCYRIRKSELIPVSTSEDIYAEDLQRTFTEDTGMDTHL